MDWSVVINTAVVGLIGLAGGSLIPLMIQARDRRNAKNDQVTAALGDFPVAADLLVVNMRELAFLHQAYSKEKRDVSDELDKQWVEGRTRRIHDVQAHLDEARVKVRQARFQVDIHGSDAVRKAADALEDAINAVLIQSQGTSGFVGPEAEQALKVARKAYVAAVRDQIGRPS